MTIGSKLKEARKKAGLTQDFVAAEILVSRQTVSNWENGHSYPDIVSIIKLSNLYQISLDGLLKGDQDVMRHLERDADLIKSNRKLIGFFTVYLLLILVLVLLSLLFLKSHLFLFCLSSLTVLSAAALIYKVIQLI